VSMAGCEWFRQRERMVRGSTFVSKAQRVSVSFSRSSVVLYAATARSKSLNVGTHR
jgi:hypothetical protein